MYLVLRPGSGVENIIFPLRHRSKASTQRGSPQRLYRTHRDLDISWMERMSRIKGKAKSSAARAFEGLDKYLRSVFIETQMREPCPAMFIVLIYRRSAGTAIKVDILLSRFQWPFRAGLF